MISGQRSELLMSRLANRMGMGIRCDLSSFRNRLSWAVNFTGTHAARSGFCLALLALPVLGQTLDLVGSLQVLTPSFVAIRVGHDVIVEAAIKPGDGVVESLKNNSVGDVVRMRSDKRAIFTAASQAQKAADWLA